MLRKKILFFAEKITSDDAGNLLINTLYFVLFAGFLINGIKTLF